jgi:hypothetical protein
MLQFFHVKTMISVYHKGEIHVAVNKVNQEETKPVFVCDYNIIVSSVYLKKGQMLQPYLLEQKKGIKLYLRLHSVAIHNAMVMYQSLLNNRIIDSLKFRPSLS